MRLGIVTSRSTKTKESTRCRCNSAGGRGEWLPTRRAECAPAAGLALGSPHREVWRVCVCQLQGKRLCAVCIIRHSLRPGEQLLPGVNYVDGLACVKLAAAHLGLHRALEWGTHCFRRGRADQAWARLAPACLGPARSSCLSRIGAPHRGTCSAILRRGVEICCRVRAPHSEKGRGRTARIAMTRRVAAHRYPAAKTRAMVLAAEAEIAHSDSDEAPPCRHRGRGSAAARGVQGAPIAAAAVQGSPRQ